MKTPIPLLAPTLAALALSAAILTLWVPSSIAATDAESSSPPGFTETIDVNIVQIEAVVTHRGDRVEGLSAENFRLRVDGKETPIEFFSEVRSGLLVTAPSPNDSNPEVPANLQPVASSEVVPTYYLVFVDDYFSLPNSRNQVLRRLQSQLGSLRPEDRMAIVAYDGRVVDMLSNWTRRDEQLELALQKASERPAYGLQRRSEWQQALHRIRPQGVRVRGSSFTSIGFSGSGLNLPGQGQPVVLENDIANKITRVADAAASSLRAFAGPPGRRVMLMLSGGMPGLGSYGISARGGLFSNLDRHVVSRDARRLLSPIVEAANLLGYTLYPVDLGNLGASPGSAEVGSIGQAELRRDRIEADENQTQDALYFLAGETGGRPYFRGARHHALEKVSEDTRFFYSVGFSPEWKSDDKPRKIQIEVDRKDHKVRSRAGFADLSRSSLMSFRVESAHQFDESLADAGALDAQFGQPVASGFGKAQVPLTLRIPLKDLALLPTRDGLKASLELRIAATDQRGQRAELGVIPVELAFDNAGSVGTHADWQTTLKLRKRDHRLLLALYDPIGNTLLSRRIELGL